MEVNAIRLLLDSYQKLCFEKVCARLILENKYEQQFATLSVKTISKNSRSFVPKKRKSPSAQRRSNKRAEQFREKKKATVDASVQVKEKDFPSSRPSFGQISSDPTMTAKPNTTFSLRSITPPRAVKRKRVDQPNVGDNAAVDVFVPRSSDKLDDDCDAANRTIPSPLIQLDGFSSPFSSASKNKNIFVSDDHIEESTKPVSNISADLPTGENISCIKVDFDENDHDEDTNEDTAVLVQCHPTDATLEISSDSDELSGDGGVPDYRELHKKANYWEGAVPFLDFIGSKLVSETSFNFRVYDSINMEIIRGILKPQTLADVLCKLVKYQDRIMEAEWQNVIFEICARILPREISNPDIIPQAKHDIMSYINHCGGIANIKRIPHWEDLENYHRNAENNSVDVRSEDVAEEDDHLEDLIALVKKQKKNLRTN